MGQREKDDVETGGEIRVERLQTAPVEMSTLRIDVLPKLAGGAVRADQLELDGNLLTFENLAQELLQIKCFLFTTESWR